MFQEFSVVMGSLTIEKRHVSSANSFTSHSKSDEISLKYNRNIRYPRIEAWGPPSLKGLVQVKMNLWVKKSPYICFCWKSVIIATITARKNFREFMCGFQEICFKFFYFSHYRILRKIRTLEENFLKTTYRNFWKIWSGT